MSNAKYFVKLVPLEATVTPGIQQLLEDPYAVGPYDTKDMAEAIATKLAGCSKDLRPCPKADSHYVMVTVQGFSTRNRNDEPVWDFTLASIGPFSKEEDAIEAARDLTRKDKTR